MSDNEKPLDHALWYADFGWPVVPIHSIEDGVCTCRKKSNCSSPGKHPRTRHGLRDATIDEGKIIKWWKRAPDANVAIVTGSASDLVVIDVDAGHGGYDSLEAVLGRLGNVPDHPIAQTGGGGVHLLFQHPGGRIPSRVDLADGIDVRADDGYIVAPSSVHASGGVYQWQIDPEKVAPPTLPERWLEWLVARACYTDTPDNTDTSRHSGVYEGGLGDDSASLKTVIKEAISATVPTGPHQRHRSLFEFARWLKAHPAIADAPVKMLKPYFRQWHSEARATIRTKPFEESWFDFAESWNHVKYPRGTGPMVEILEKAAAAKLPAAALEYEQTKLRLLVAICRELQQRSGDEPFFLSARMAGELVGVSPQHAARWLNGLIVNDVLQRVSKGSRIAHKASEFRYLPPLKD